MSRSNAAFHVLQKCRSAPIKRVLHATCTVFSLTDAMCPRSSVSPYPPRLLFSPPLSPLLPSITVANSNLRFSLFVLHSNQDYNGTCCPFCPHSSGDSQSTFFFATAENENLLILCICELWSDAGCHRLKVMLRTCVWTLLIFIRQHNDKSLWREFLFHTKKLLKKMNYNRTHSPYAHMFTVDT